MKDNDEQSNPSTGSLLGECRKCYLLGGSRDGEVVTVQGYRKELEVPVADGFHGRYVIERYWLATFTGRTDFRDLQYHYVIDGKSGEWAADRLRELPRIVG